MVYEEKESEITIMKNVGVKPESDALRFVLPN